MAETRKLAAILVADIVGYSRLVGADEDRTLARLRALRSDLIDPTIAAHHGRVVKRTGDGSLVEFRSMVDAVRCAIEVQRGMVERNTGFPPERHIEFRIGIHLGDVVEESDGDLMGDGVNIAARLEGIAKPGSICLSEDAYRQVKTRLDLAVSDLGEQQLKNIVQPIRAYALQVGVPAQSKQATSSAQTAAPSPATNNLPQHLSPLIGRESEFAEVKQLMGTTNLLTLVGAGGIGKTRFSLEVASALLDRFSAGVWFVELAPVADPALVPRTVAEVLGVNEEPGRPLLDTLLQFLRGRQILVILDNCEHLIEACARFAEAALRFCRELRILASSREALGISGELEWRLPGLPTPDVEARESADQLMQYSAVRLFVARAAFVSPSFRLTDDNSAAVARICRQLDGIPLALELAAARVKAMRVEQIDERLDNRFQLLASGNRTALPHQQTLRSAIDWSHDLLDESERMLLRRLSVFAGGWTLEAAEAVCGGNGIQSDDVLDLMMRLVDKSLVVPDETAAAPRYRMLETIRQYGREKLVEANEVEQIGDRHLTFFTREAEWLGPRFLGPDQVRWYAKADVELDNLRAALEHSLSPKRVGDGMRMGRALHRYWVARIYWREANGWLKRLLAVSGTDNTPLRARTLFVIGHITNYYDPTQARSFAEDSLRLARSLDYKEGIIDALWLMGWLNYPKLDGTAVPYFEESIELARAIDHVFGAVHAYAWYGVYKIGVGDYEGAKLTLREGMAQAERVADYFAKVWGPREGTLQTERIGGDATLLGRCAGNLGLVAMLQGDFVAAKSYLDQSLALVRGADNRNSIAETLWLQGRLALRQNEFDLALYHFKESLALYRTYTTSVWVTRDLVYMAILQVARNQFTIAAQLVGVLDARDRTIGSINVHLASRASIAEYQSAVENLRARMPAAAFDAEWKAGHGLTVEQSIELALS